MKNLITTLILAFTAITLSAAEEFNLRKDTINLIVAAPPGAGRTILGNRLSQLMKEKGITVLVVNKPGANRIIGTNFVASSVPDGRTLLFGGAADLALLPKQYPDVVKFTRSSFVPVMSMVRVEPVLIVRKDFPANNFKEFLEVIKRDPLQRQTSDFSVHANMIASSIYSLAGVSPEFITYAGETQAVMDVASGQLQSAVVALEDKFLPSKLSERIKLIAITSDKRSSKFPNVETVSETFPNVVFQYWWGLYAPAGTPDATVKELNKAFAEVWSDPKMVAELKQQNYQPGETSLPALNAYLDKEYKTLDLMANRYLK
jgi:tripartite-type tricarboxylate transporter receptor subunit TctC